ncbi:hypothetical protein SV7mr_32450 [Stieleria bergensis]|uniref:Uncharacterized protein n=1 Tax=Stieleria bergensis TaxID=2528025 RepID=A0A517SX44_9BACT|nr:hypothetical protein SV7mr_32450 [Planctomycetes bacterium SV_7m_r]
MPWRSLYSKRLSRTRCRTPSAFGNLVPGACPQGALRDPGLWGRTPSAFRHSIRTGIRDWGRSQSNEPRCLSQLPPSCSSCPSWFIPGFATIASFSGLSPTDYERLHGQRRWCQLSSARVWARCLVLACVLMGLTAPFVEHLRRSETMCVGSVPRVRCATLGYGVEHLRRSETSV